MRYLPIWISAAILVAAYNLTPPPAQASDTGDRNLERIARALEKIADRCK